MGFDDTPIDELLSTVNKWHRNIDLLVDWTRYQRAYNKCKKVGFGKYLDEMLVQEFKPAELVTTFKKVFLSRFVQYILDQRPILKEFEALTQNQIVRKFQQLDKYQLELAKFRITERLFKQKPDANWEGSRLSELGYLQRQFRLKRGHHPIRKIFTKVPNVVQKLCPCFMMSPLSLSQYIDPRVMKFDIVVFDEASQIYPADSLGAIIRGDQGVIVGDTKQLPPTTFFESIVQTIEDDEHIDDLATPGLESILDECLTIGLKEFTLKWHYRSRDESLIHFSNKKFYKNELTTFPSPNRDLEHFGLSLVHIKDSEYDRGGSGKNRKEAQEVAKAVFKHFKINPEKSLGVGAFSQAQQIAILDEIELLRRQDPSLESFFTGSHNEPFFVKNLETIQGDERDIIFISIGYGRDPTGKLSMNFGPVNREGGERRLNVLVVRFIKSFTIKNIYGIVPPKTMEGLCQVKAEDQN